MTDRTRREDNNNNNIIPSRVDRYYDDDNNNNNMIVRRSIDRTRTQPDTPHTSPRDSTRNCRIGALGRRCSTTTLGRRRCSSPRRSLPAGGRARLFLNLALTSIAGVAIGRLRGPPSGSIGRGGRPGFGGQIRL